MTPVDVLFGAAWDAGGAATEGMGYASNTGLSRGVSRNGETLCRGIDEAGVAGIVPEDVSGESISS